MKRTHGVCLRWLAERFRQPDVRLYYERSVLQAADIYTKGFTVPAEWDRVVRLVNLLDPMRFWGRSREILAGQMGSEHKGGVSFSYWTPNPWYGRESMTIPTPCSVDASSSAAPVLVNIPERDAHVPWIIPPMRGGVAAATTADGHVATTTVDEGKGVGDLYDEPHYEDYFAEAPCFDSDEYASTCAPDSDDESLEDLSDSGGC